MYKGTLLEWVVKLQRAYDKPIQSIRDVPQVEKTKGSLVCKQFSPCTPRHNRTKSSYEENDNRLRKLENELCFDNDLGG